MRAVFGLRCLRHLRWFWLMCHVAFGSCEGSRSSISHIGDYVTSDGRLSGSLCSCPWLVTFAALRHTFVGNLRFPPFSRSPAGMFPLETTQGLRIMYEECGCHCHSTAFYRFWMGHCVITMGNTLNSSIFDTCRLSCIYVKFPCDYTWCGPIAIKAHLSMGNCTGNLVIPWYCLTNRHLSGFLAKPVQERKWTCFTRNRPN